MDFQVYDRFFTAMMVTANRFPKVRKRYPGFPNGAERRAEFVQPSTMAHTDFLSTGAFLLLADIFLDRTSYYKTRRFDLTKYVFKKPCKSFN